MSMAPLDVAVRAPGELVIRVFYSWQSDLPKKTNRTLIGEALERSAKRVRDDETIEIEPVIDRDTRGVRGTPDISATIFEKIAAADLFVADVSLINHRARKYRHTPNPNVLVELGFAAARLGWESIVCVFNTAYGKVDELPFDLQGRRCVPYRMEEQDAPATARGSLEALFVDVFKDLDHPTEPEHEPLQTSTVRAVKAIAENVQGRAARIRAFLNELEPALVELKPPNADGRDHESLVQALEATIPLQLEWGLLCSSVASDGDERAVLAACEWFERLLRRYRHPPAVGGAWCHTDFDFFKFIGAEAFVILVACLLRDKRWDLLASVLSKRFLHETGAGPKHVDYTRLCRVTDLLRIRSEHTRRISVHADLLESRFTGALETVCTWTEFRDADLLLCLHTNVGPEGAISAMWRPWSSLSLDQTVPHLFVRLREREYASGTAQAMGVDLEVLRGAIGPVTRCLQQEWRVRAPFFELEEFDPSTIATV